MKHKVVNAMPGPDDPELEPDDRERLRFAEFCRGATTDCGAYAERLLALCALGTVALGSRDGISSPNPAQSILGELVLLLPPVLEQLVIVERDLALLGWGAVKVYSTKPPEEVKAWQERLQLSAQGVDAPHPGWVKDKLPSVQAAVGELRELLLDARSGYLRDCELFEAASGGRTNIPPEQMGWLKNIQFRTTKRVEHIDQVLNGLDREIRPCLENLAKALESDVRKAVRAVSRS